MFSAPLSAPPRSALPAAHLTRPSTAPAAGNCSARRLATLQMVQGHIADMAIEIDAAALLVYRAAWTKDTGAARGDARSGHGQALRHRGGAARHRRSRADSWRRRRAFGSSGRSTVSRNPGAAESTKELPMSRKSSSPDRLPQRQGANMTTRKTSRNSAPPRTSIRSRATICRPPINGRICCWTGREFQYPEYLNAGGRTHRPHGRARLRRPAPR